MERYFYFRDVADEANDSDDGASVMVPVKNITAIAPGTGKTTTLLNYVQTEMESVPIEKIGYFSFTRKAANEARDRAIEKFG